MNFILIEMTEKPLINLLNAKGLLAQLCLNNKVDSNILVRGLKATFSENTDEEKAAIKSYHGW